MGKKKATRKKASTENVANGHHLSPSPSSSHANGSAEPLRAKKSPSAGMKNRLERETILLWRRPFTTLQYFILESGHVLIETISWLWSHLAVLLVLSALGVGLAWAYASPGPHQSYIGAVEAEVFWCAYWVGLGVLSSVGLGTGLHTFLLYLGPFIAKVTLAAYECGSVDFPQPPYPDKVECPPSGLLGAGVTLWAIMTKVRKEAFMWGAGTALGELPPYFMARAARLSGEAPDDPEYLEFLQFQRQAGELQEEGLLNRIKIGMENLVKRVGFFGILLCASIPNPLFDLAGITCGHFLVPFWTFFGATLIGKAVVKMHIQKLFVILTFSEHHVENLIDLIGKIPRVGKTLREPFKAYFLAQKTKFHHGKPATGAGPNWLGWALEKLVLGMVLFFVVSIINSWAQAYHKRIANNSKAKKE